MDSEGEWVGEMYESGILLDSSLLSLPSLLRSPITQACIHLKSRELYYKRPSSVCYLHVPYLA
jgi:hypothetical protein